MTNYQRVTFIIPCRNNVKYLKQAINSIEDCYGDTHNIVILDDASTDGTWEWVQLMEDKHIEIAPLGFMRGRTFKNTWIVADEMQNSTISQMKMLLTRLGENSRLIITGDLEQFDKPDMVNGLDDFLNKVKGEVGRINISDFYRIYLTHRLSL
jgi:predicted ribonuclease YlaK